jgi:hypothetical protein
MHKSLPGVARCYVIQYSGYEYMNCSCHRICYAFSCSVLWSDEFLQIFTGSWPRIMFARTQTLHSELDIFCVHNFATMVQAGRSRVRLPVGVTEFFSIYLIIPATRHADHVALSVRKSRH